MKDHNLFRLKVTHVFGGETKPRRLGVEETSLQTKYLKALMKTFYHIGFHVFGQEDSTRKGMLQIIKIVTIYLSVDKL